MEKFFRAVGEELQTLLNNEGFRKLEDNEYLDDERNVWTAEETGGGTTLTCEDIEEDDNVCPSGPRAE